MKSKSENLKRKSGFCNQIISSETEATKTKRTLAD